MPQEVSRQGYQVPMSPNPATRSDTAHIEPEIIALARAIGRMLARQDHAAAEERARRAAIKR